MMLTANTVSAIQPDNVKQQSMPVRFVLDI